MTTDIFSEIERSETADDLFDLINDYYRGQGFGGICYVAPSAAAGPYVLMHRGMPEDWMARYEAQQLHLHDPIPGLAFQLGHPERLDELIATLPSLNSNEQAFMEAFKNSGLTNGLLVPTYGPFGRPGLIGLTQIAHPALLDELNIPLVSAVAHQMHNRMELLQVREPIPGLSPRERQILKWLGKGKSNSDIAAILGLALPTVVTHVKRIYHKLRVHDRVTCVAKALAHHYLP